MKKKKGIELIVSLDEDCNYFTCPILINEKEKHINLSLVVDKRYNKYAVHLIDNDDHELTSEYTSYKEAKEIFDLIIEYYLPVNADQLNHVFGFGDYGICSYILYNYKRIKIDDFKKCKNFLNGSTIDYPFIFNREGYIIGSGVIVEISQDINNLDIFSIILSNMKEQIYKKNFNNYKDTLNEFNKIEINENYLKENGYKVVNQ